MNFGNLRDFSLWRDRLTLIIVAFLPWQARFIRVPGEFRGVAWEQGTIGLFALEAAVLLALLCHVVSRTSSQPPNVSGQPSWLKLWGVFIVYAGCSVFWAAYPEAALFGWVHLISGLALCYLISLSRFDVKTFLGAFLVGSVANALLALWQFFAQEVFASTWLGVAGHSSETPGVSVVETSGGRFLRAYGLLPHPNVLGAYAAAACAAATALAVSAVSLRARRLALLAGLLSAAALAASFSRSAWIAVAFMLLVGLRSLRGKPEAADRSRLRKALAVQVIGFAAIVLLAMPVMTARVTGTGRLETKSFSERGISVARGVELFLLSPAFGVGLGNMVPSAYDVSWPKHPAWEYQPAHLAPALAAAELGFLGLMLVVGAVGFWFAALRFSLPWAKDLPATTALILPFVPIVGGLFDHWPISTFAGVMLTGLCFGLFLHQSSKP